MHQGTGQALSEPVQRAIEYIQEHYREHIHLPDVAEYAGVPTTYISKLLHLETGKTFPELLNSARIAEARQLLRNNNIKIQEVALQTGFEDPAHFARAFKRTTGVTANRYRIGTFLVL